ncbi:MULTISPECIES: ABC transporter ATP-binding protein [unclassified Brucella]|uniref:ABC transporter ATP-binding protein n=1 Tax=unclassified Brucella TaxID=2632610 RepID=UPI0010FD8A30|nr:MULTISPECIES: ABC transporter ATP-binding protein [unclassified Brucella]MRN67375.1 ATP-binding cassette domain-containing protein [Brucella sp. 10RB9213]
MTEHRNAEKRHLQAGMATFGTGSETVVLDKVTKSYGGFNAISDASFRLMAGENIALVGHNGAGKTTMIKLMLGLIRPTKGAVRVLGEDPAAGAFAARLRLGYLPEHVSFNMALTGAETLGFYARLKQVPFGQTDALLERVGLAHAAHRRVGTYSKGMRQRLGLAQALLGQPAVLLLDEPTTGLDPALRQSFYEILEGLRQEGTTILMSSHALTELETKVGRVIIANKGKVIADGSIDALRRISRLPMRIRVEVNDVSCLPVETGNLLLRWHRLGPDLYETEAPAEGKMELVRRIVAMNDNLNELDIIPPTLDELYAHFLNMGDAAVQEAAE